MSSDDDIYLTVCQIFQQFGGLFGSACPRQIIHTDRHIFQTGGKSAEVLIGKYRCRYEHCHLFTIGSCLESCTHSHLRLAESHITADKTVHRLGHLHVSLHILRGL